MFVADLFSVQNGNSNQSDVTNVIEYILCNVPNIIDFKSSGLYPCEGQSLEEQMHMHMK